MKNAFKTIGAALQSILLAVLFTVFVSIALLCYLICVLFICLFIAPFAAVITLIYTDDNDGFICLYLEKVCLTVETLFKELLVSVKN